MSWNESIQGSFRLQADGKLQARFGLPCSELLLASYSCAMKLKHSILLQGRMYVFPRHIGFACDLLGQVKSISLRFSEIDSIKKAKTALVVPNAISIQTNNGNAYFFASFLSRNEAFRLVYDLWAIAKGVAKAQHLDGMESAGVEILERSAPYIASSSGRLVNPERKFRFKKPVCDTNLQLVFAMRKKQLNTTKNGQIPESSRYLDLRTI
jgi:hypothetical protein